MTTQSHVSICKRPGSQFWHAHWTDQDGRDRIRSLETDVYRDAENVAELISEELDRGYDVDGRDPNKGRMTWNHAVRLYKSNSSKYLASSPAFKSSVDSTIRAVSELIHPVLLSDLDDNAIMELGGHLRNTSARGGMLRSEATIARHFRTLRIVLKWCYARKLTSQIPTFEMPRSGDSKGRPLSADEFERFKAEIINVSENDRVVARSRQHLIDGLMLSGLRLGEADKLSWDDPNKIHVDLSDKDAPIFVIPGYSQKNRKEKPAPMAPDFAEFLERTPIEQRHGFVFNPLNMSHQRIEPQQGWCSAWISQLGKRANIRVSETPTRTPGIIDVKYASAHDLRRSFGERWALIVEPNLLMEMMRHSTFETTKKFYLTRNARDYSQRIKQLWQKQ